MCAGHAQCALHISIYPTPRLALFVSCWTQTGRHCLLDRQNLGAPDLSAMESASPSNPPSLRKKIPKDLRFSAKNQLKVFWIGLDPSPLFEEERSLKI